MSKPECSTQQLVQCEFCSTIRPKNEIYDADVCADGSCGMHECCIAKRCVNGCTFKCSSCLKIFKQEEVVYIDDTDTERIFVCINCYDTDKINWCECSRPPPKNYDDDFQHFPCKWCHESYDNCMCRECDGHWSIIGDGVLKCSSCDAERTEKKINIWNGISEEEWLRRYD